MKKALKNRLKAEVVWAYTRSGAFQRSNIYRPNATEEEKYDFRSSVKQFLFEEVFVKFFNRVITEKKLGVITKDFIDNNQSKALNGKKLKYGNAQKFVNLYLKGMWILGYLKTPPHFPVDRIMLGLLKIKENWTAMNEKTYDIVIAKAKNKLKESDFKTIAEWEACEYQKNYVDK